MNLPPIEGFGFIADIREPAELGSSLYLQGCNFNCPYCLNRGLLSRKNNLVDPDFIINRLQLRMEHLVVLSGGEPFIHDSILDLCDVLKCRNFEVAVATNGSFPDKIKKGTEMGVIDHVIMDVKTVLEKSRYEEVVGRSLKEKEFNNILESVDYLVNGPCYKPSTEFRTTVCSKFVSREDLISIANYLGSSVYYVLQPFTVHQTLDPSLADKKYIVPFETLVEWSKKLEKIVFSCIVREV
jgi:pyruvate formate lyase activating enzyme